MTAEEVKNYTKVPPCYVMFTLPILLLTSFFFSFLHKPNYYQIFFNCCFTVHFDKYKIILPTNTPFIKT